MTKTQADQILMDYYGVTTMRFPVAAPQKRPDDYYNQVLEEDPHDVNKIDVRYNRLNVANDSFRQELEEIRQRNLSRPDGPAQRLQQIESDIQKRLHSRANSQSAIEEERERLTRRDPPLQIQQTPTVVESKAAKVTEIHSAAIFDIIPAIEDEAQRNVAARRILRCFSSNFSEKTLELTFQDNKFAIGFELNPQECAAYGIDQIDEHGLAVILACAKSFITDSRGSKTPYYRAMIVFGVNEPKKIELGFESKLSNYLQNLGEKYQEWLSAPVSSFPTYLEDLAETATQIQLSNNKEMDLFIKKGSLEIYGTLGTIATTAAAFALIGPITGIITLCVCLFALGAVHRTLSS